MSDPPTPPEASGDALTPLAPEASAPRQRRPWTILGRLTQAVREQSWFAVALEVVIVIVGVVVGFQITAWGQDRADRAREQQYLRQLVKDLTETERSFEQGAPFLWRGDSSATALVRAFRAADTPPADSVLLWVQRAGRFDRPFIVTGTAAALVETGDINLVQNDSLRSAITRYIDIAALATGWMRSNAQRAVVHLDKLNERLDSAEGILIGMTEGERDSLARSWPMYPFPDEVGRTPMPLDVEALLADRAAYTSVWGLWRRRYLMGLNRNYALRETQSLKRQLQAEIDR